MRLYNREVSYTYTNLPFKCSIRIECGSTLLHVTAQDARGNRNTVSTHIDNLSSALMDATINRAVHQLFSNFDCDNCVNCTNCIGCRNCTNCNECSECLDYKNYVKHVQCPGHFNYSA
jgi:hypothetical protein